MFRKPIPGKSFIPCLLKTGFILVNFAGHIFHKIVDLQKTLIIRILNFEEHSVTEAKAWRSVWVLDAAQPPRVFLPVGLKASYCISVSGSYKYSFGRSYNSCINKPSPLRSLHRPDWAFESLTLWFFEPKPCYLTQQPIRTAGGKGGCFMWFFSGRSFRANFHILSCNAINIECLAKKDTTASWWGPRFWFRSWF